MGVTARRYVAAYGLGHRMDREVHPSVALTRAEPGHYSYRRPRVLGPYTRPGGTYRPAREANWQKYLDRARELAPDGADQADVEYRAECLRRADMHRLALASAKARAGRKQAS